MPASLSRPRKALVGARLTIRKTSQTLEDVPGGDGALAEHARLGAGEVDHGRRRARQLAGVEHQIHVYPGAPHSFFDRRASDHAEASEDAWRRVLGFLEGRAPS